MACYRHAFVSVRCLLPRPFQRTILSIVFLLSLLHIDKCDSLASEFNTQLMPRITERLDEFLGIPIDLTKHYLKYAERSGFKRPLDRNALFKDMFAQTVSSQVSGFSASVFLSFEDGMYILAQNVDGQIILGYRERGFSGYNVTNIQPDDPNYKYWGSCFNYTDGTPQECLLLEEEVYIECVNDCELIQCPSNDTSVVNSTETILCRNYNIKKVQKGDELGYIPYFDLCNNRRGEPEQRVGYVVTNLLSNELGNCYYWDMTTIVNNSLNGDYAACGGDGAICDNAFHGASYQDSYDPRHRPWYVASRNALKPWWTEPLIYVGTFYLYFAYKHPIFSTQIENDTEVKVFEGVTSIDYRLHHITEFLRNEYSGSAFQVLVVERNSPHYIIATSYHAGQFQLKAVLTDDETKSCPDKKIQAYVNNSSEYFGFDLGNCTLARIPISDMKDSKNESDVVMYRAFSAHQRANFPADSVVNLKLTDDIGSRAYLSQGKIYQLPQSDNTAWHVLAILPMARATNDSALPGDVSFSAICVCGSLGLFGCLGLFFVFFQRRTERAMINADWRFTCAFLLGCASVNLSSFTLLGESTNPTCMLRMWSFNGLFACALSPLFVKVWRMAILINASRGFKRTTVGNFAAFLYTLPLITLQVFILLLFSMLDPPKLSEHLGVGIGVQQITCDHQTNAFFITQVVFDGFLVFVGCVLAYRTRNIDPRYGEAKQLGFSMYNIAFTGLFTLLIVHMVDLDAESKMILQAVGVLWASFMCSFSFVLPRLEEVAKEKSSNSLRFSYGSELSPTETREKLLSSLGMSDKYIQAHDELGQKADSDKNAETDNVSPDLVGGRWLSFDSRNEEEIAFESCPQEDELIPTRKGAATSSNDRVNQQEDETSFPLSTISKG